MTGQAVERHQGPAGQLVLSDREIKSIEFQAGAITALDKRLEPTKAELEAHRNEPGWAAEQKRQKGKALAVTLYSLGLPVTITNAKKLHIIGDEIVESSQLLVGLLAMHGHEVRVVEESNERAVVRGRRHGTGEPHEVTYTIDQARTSGALDEWVEKWEESGGGKRYPVRHYLVFEGERNDAEPEAWAKTAIARKQTKRLDAWHKYPSDMLVNRAVRRLAKRMGGDALLGVGGPEWDDDGPPAVAPLAMREDDIVVVDPDEEVEVESGTLPEDEAPTAPGDTGPDPVAAHRNECSQVYASFAEIPTGLWRQQWAKAWQEAGYGKARDLTPEQLEPARRIVRCYTALAALDELGFKGAAERHAFVAKATGGETESTKGLTAEQLLAVLEAVADELAFRESAAADDAAGASVETDPFD